MEITSVIRYFVLPESQIGRHTAMLIPDHDDLPISNLKIIRYPYPVNDGRFIVKVELPKYMLQALAEACGSYDIADPLTMEGVAALGIGGSYVGISRNDVLERFPELDGFETFMDSEGQETQNLKFPRKMWSFETITG